MKNIIPIKTRTWSLLIGLFICLVGFSCAISAISIAVYNYKHGNENNLRYERVILEIVGQILLFVGFLIIYLYIIQDHRKLKDW